MSEAFQSPNSLPSNTATEHQLQELANRAISPEFAAANGVSSVQSVDDLPEEFRSTTLAQIPGLLFTWYSPTQGEVFQYRPDHPLEVDGSKIKYVFAPKQKMVLTELRKADSDTLLLVEGTCQSLAAARYAPVGVGVYGMSGCWNWRVGATGTSIPDLGVVKGKNVLVVLDSDAATNPDVYKAGVALKEALEYEMAESVHFVRLAAGKKAGLDDVLADRPEGTRVDFMSTMIRKARADKNEKPAAKEPKAKDKKAEAGPWAPPAGKAAIEATDTDVAIAFVERKGADLRWDSTTERWLTYHDGLWDSESGTTLAKSKFREVVLNEIVAVEYDENGDPFERREWLRSATRITSVMHCASTDPAIHVRAKELDPDPILWNAANCVINLRTGQPMAHDPKFLMTQRSEVVYDPDAEAPTFMEFIQFVLPDEETRAYVQRILGMAMLGEVRDHVFPVFIGTGRNGKGTLIRLALRVFGTYATGIKRDVLVDTRFEGHQTKLATLFKKRLATTEELAANAVWDVATVKTLTGGDAITANYMRQDDFTFDPSHTLLLSTNHRPKVGEGEHAFWSRYREIPFTRTFENPDADVEARMMTELPGILNWMLDGLTDYWDNYGGKLGEPAQVMVASADAKVSSDPMYRFLSEELEKTGNPDDLIHGVEMRTRYERWCEKQQPRETPVGTRLFTKALATAAGLQYADDATCDTPRLRYEGKSNIRFYRRLRWAEDGGNGGGPTGGGSLTEELTAAATANQGGVTASATANPAGGADVSPGQTVPVTAVTANTAKDGVLPYAKETDQAHTHNPPMGTPCTDPAVFAVAAVTPMPSPGETHKVWSPGAVAPAVASARVAVTGAVALDLETGSADMRVLFSSGPEYLRLAGYQVDQADIVTTTDVADVVERVTTTDRIIGHNVMGFDLIALARHAGVSIAELVAEDRVVDTKILAMLADPPPAKMKEGEAEKYYSLDNVGDRLLGHRKHGDLKALAREFGGFDQIPTDDARFVEYLRGDVQLTRELADVLPLTEYGIREHKVAAIGAQLTLSGFRVDVPLLQERYSEGEARRAELVGMLQSRYGLPMLKKDGKPSSAPHRTEGGKKAIEAALIDAGLPEENIPRTATGAAKLDKDTMAELIEFWSEHAPGIVDVVEAVKSLNGIRSIYGTVLDHLVGDRVHPTVSMRQATGRWSIQDPGLTVFGKRGGKARERAVMLPDEGHVLISADLSQIDARAVAAWSQDENYMALFGPGMDLHAEVARMVFGDPSKRELAKVISHGANYGLGVNGLLARHPHIDRGLAEQFYAMQAEQFPGVADWKADVRAKGGAGELLDNGFGRLLRVQPDRAYTQAPALVGQAAARDLMMEGMLRMPAEVQAMIRAVVHDEVVLSVPIDIVEDVERIVLESLSFEWAPPGKSRPIQVEGGLGERGLSWAGCYGAEYGEVWAA